MWYISTVLFFWPGYHFYTQTTKKQTYKKNIIGWTQPGFLIQQAYYLNMKLGENNSCETHLPNKILKLVGEIRLKVAQTAGRFRFELRNMKSVADSGRGKQLRSDSGGINALNHKRTTERRRKLRDSVPRRDLKKKSQPLDLVYRVVFVFSGGTASPHCWDEMEEMVKGSPSQPPRDCGDGQRIRGKLNPAKGDCPPWWAGGRDTCQRCFKLVCPLLCVRVETRRQAHVGSKIVQSSSLTTDLTWLPLWPHIPLGQEWASI